MAVDNVALYEDRAPAAKFAQYAEIIYRIPFISCPKNGRPPDASGVMVEGGNPSVNDAALTVVEICDGTGIGILMYAGFDAPKPKGFAISRGVTRVLDMSLSYQTLVLITTETPGGVGMTPDCSKIAS